MGDKKAKRNKNKEKNEAMKLLGKKTKRTNEDKDNETSEKENIEFVGKKSDESDSESEYDMDKKAEIMAIATKMLRKKDRLDILNGTYNRFAFDDSDMVPDW